MGRRNKTRFPTTPATRLLQAHDPHCYTPLLYDYEDRGGAKVAAQKLGVPLHHVVKTLIMHDEHDQGLIVLMHGDCHVNTGELARQIGTKRVTPFSPEQAQKHSGYLVGGTSPFGTRKRMPIYAERSIFEIEDQIIINAGKRGFMFAIAPQLLHDVFDPEGLLHLVQVAIRQDDGHLDA